VNIENMGVTTDEGVTINGDKTLETIGDGDVDHIKITGKTTSL